VLRHELFRHDLRGSSPHKLTPIASLLGNNDDSHGGSTHHHHRAPVLLLAMLHHTQATGTVLEDPSGQVPVRYSADCNAATVAAAAGGGDGALVVTDGSFITSHSIVLVEGHMQDGCMHVHRMGQPLPEPPAVSVRAIQQHVAGYCSRISTRNRSVQDNSDDDNKDEDHSSFVLLQDVYLDQPRVVQNLEGLLAGYEKYSVDRMPSFVLMGNFNAPLDELLTVLIKFPRLHRHATFVVVPGPADTDSYVWPLPPLKTGTAARLLPNKLVLTTNPCRIRYGGNRSEMVICRYDLLQLYQQHKLAVQYDTSGTGEVDDDNCTGELPEPHSRMLKTMLDQGTLLPHNALPVIWNCSHAFDLYPVPDCLVVGSGSNERCVDEVYNDTCQYIQPGSFGETGTYAVYQFDDDDDDDDEVGTYSVYFLTMGPEAEANAS
jgi:DNA polymerase alpha/epsilon subunit B